MSRAYVDTSCVVAVAFGEPGFEHVSSTLDANGALTSSNLLEAELRSAFAREGFEYAPGFALEIDWVLPDRPLGTELRRVLEAGYLRGADLWHLAVALYVAESPSDMAFLTLDERQAGIAGALGFATPLPGTLP